jgi:Ca2+-binding RTX toxin-like protein
MVNDSMYQRPLTGAKDAQLILTIAGLNDTTLISVADFVISGEVILGTSGADSKTGTTGDDGLHGGAGADTLSGGDGNDYLTGDASTGGSSADWFLITSGNDTILDLAAGNVADVVQVSAGATVAATVYGNWTATSDTSNAGTATIDARGKTVVLTNAVGPNGWYLKDTSTVATAFTGSAFADTIQGGEGADTITGGAGSDTASYSTSAAGVTVSLALATAQVSTGDANSDVLSSIENLVGSAFADELTGDSADNIISGGAGNDTIMGGVGSDTFTGGGGADTFVFVAGDSSELSMDVITDFNSTDDLLSVLAIVPSHAWAVINVGTHADYAAVKAAAADAISSDSWPVFGNDGLNTWVFLDDSHDLSLDSSDTVIKLTGVLTLTDAHFV